MLRTILRLRADGAGWAWIVDELDDLFDPPAVPARSRPDSPVRFIAGAGACGLPGAERAGSGDGCLSGSSALPLEGAG